MRLKFETFKAHLRRQPDNELQPVIASLEELEVLLQEFDLDPQKIFDVSLSRAEITDHILSDFFISDIVVLDQVSIADLDPASDGESQIKTSPLLYTDIIVRLQSFVGLSYRLIREYSIMQHTQDIIRFGAGGAGFEGSWKLSQFPGAPGVGAMLSINVASLLTQWVRQCYGDASPLNRTFLTGLGQLSFTIAIFDAVARYLGNIEKSIIGEYHTPVDELIEAILATMAAYFLALGFAAMQNSFNSFVHFIAKKCCQSSLSGFYADAKFTAKIMAAHAAFHGTPLLSEAIFGATFPVADSIITAGLITAAGTGIVATGQHLTTLARVDQIIKPIMQDLNGPEWKKTTTWADCLIVRPIGMVTRPAAALLTYPITQAYALARIVSKGVSRAGLFSRTFACCRGRNAQNDDELEDTLRKGLIIN